MQSNGQRFVCPNRAGAIGIIAFAMSTLWSNSCAAAELLVGGATISITPSKPVALDGQMNTRIARKVESEVTATALALESSEGATALDQAILVSCDLVGISKEVLEATRERLKRRLGDFAV